MVIQPRDLIGDYVEGSADSWFIAESVQDRRLIHAWGRFTQVGWVQFRMHAGIDLRSEEPHENYSMDELRSRVDVEFDGAGGLGPFNGGRVLAVTRLTSAAFGEEIGLVLRTSRGDVAIIDEADDLAIGVWPDPDRWPPDRVVEAPSS